VEEYKSIVQESFYEKEVHGVKLYSDIEPKRPKRGKKKKKKLRRKKKKGEEEGSGNSGNQRHGSDESAELRQSTPSDE